MGKFQRKTAALPDIPGEPCESVADWMKITLGLDPANRKTVAPGLSHVDVDRDLAQTTLDYERVEKLRVFEQGLAVSHEHRHQTNADRVAHDLDQLVRATRPPIGIGDIAARDL